MEDLLLHICGFKNIGFAAFVKDYQILVGGLLAFIAGIITYLGYRRGHRLEGKKISRQEIAFLWVFKIVMDSLRVSVTEAKEDLESKIGAAETDGTQPLCQVQLEPVSLPRFFLEPWSIPVAAGRNLFENMERLREEVQLLNPIIPKLNAEIDRLRVKRESPRQVSFLDQHSDQILGFEELLEKFRLIAGKYNDIEDSIKRVVENLRNEVEQKEKEKWW